MKIFKNIIVSVLVAVITVVAMYGGYTIYAQNDDSMDFTKSGLDFEEVFDLYNGTMNNYFNKKIEKLNALLENPKFFEKPEFKVPGIINPQKDTMDQILKKCGEDNVSTYCVSMGALKIYMSYINKLNEVRSELPKSRVFNPSAGELLRQLSVRNQQIDEEVENAKKVMKLTVAVYNEYRLAYPMHKKYEAIIKDLVKYQLAMKDITKQVAKFPIKFINVTSSLCE